MKLKSPTHRASRVRPTAIVPKQFYCGSPAVFLTGWAKGTLDAAITHARTLLADDPKRASVAIVKVIRVVRRDTQPVTVCHVVAK